MNKQFYRTKFNAKLGTYVAVSELAKSHQGDTSPRIKASIHNDDVTGSGIAATGQRTLKQLVLALSCLMAISPIYANIVVNNNAAAAHKATVLKEGNSANVWITAPSASGVSRNSYTQFDVNQNGVILNNSRGAATSQITKTSIAANPNLAKGAATTIVNEVVSTNPSLLQGNLEVLGSRANVVIANPTGITVNGGGFINANQVTLSTGVLGYNTDGSIKNHTIKQGAITINPDANNRGLGGNANNPVALELLGRSIAINAPVNATAITAVTGANTITAEIGTVAATTGTGTKPSVAIDVAQLGGLYANSIYLHANEAGVGVNNAGIIQGLNNVVLNSNGKIEHKGTISSTSKTQGLVSISTTGTGVTGDINSSGAINSNSMISIDSGNNLNLNAKEIMVNLGGVTASPLLINVKGNLNLAANSRIFNNSQSGELYVDAANINLATNAGITSNRGSAYIQSQKDIVTAQGARLVAAQDLNVSGKGKLALTGTTLQATLGSINLQADSSNMQGLVDVQISSVNAGKDLNIYSSGDINLKNLTLVEENAKSRVKNIKAYSGQNLTWDNSEGLNPNLNGNLGLKAEKDLAILGKGIFRASENIDLKGNNVNIKSLGLTTSLGDTNITSNSNIDLKYLNINSVGGNLNLLSEGGEVNASSVGLSGKKNINILTMGNQNLDSVKISSGQDIFLATSSDKGNINIVADSLNMFSSGLIQSENGDVLINSKGGLNISKKDLMNFFAINANNINLTSGGDLKLDYLNINSKENLAIHSDKNISLNTELPKSGIFTGFPKDFAKSQKHIAISSKNGSIKIGEQNPRIDASITNLKAEGVISVKSKSDQNYQNATLSAGAITLHSDAGSINNSDNFRATTTKSTFLDSDNELKKINGNLSLYAKKDIQLNAIDSQGRAYNKDLQNVIKPVLSSQGLLDIRADGVLQVNGKAPPVQTATWDQRKLDRAYLRSDNGLNVLAGTVKLYATDLKNTSTTVPINITSSTGDILIDAMRYDVGRGQLDLIIPIQNRRDQLEASGKKDAATLNEIQQLNGEIAFYLSSDLNGARHQSSNIDSAQNINLVSKKGTLIRASELYAKGSVNLEAQGLLAKDQTGAQASDYIDTSILVDGVHDIYKNGVATNPNYEERSDFYNSVISGDKGINIKSTGSAQLNWFDNPALLPNYATVSSAKPLQLKKKLNDGKHNIVLNGAELISSGGDVNIQSNANIIMESSLDEIYKHNTSQVIKKYWYGRKKTTETYSQSQIGTAVPTTILAKNINLKASGDIDFYSTLMKANGGKVNIVGENLYFLASNNSASSNSTTKKSSSIFGIPLNKSKTTSSRSQISQLPVKLVGDYLSTESKNDTVFVGTEFNYLKDATVKAGGKIALLGATDTVNQALKVEKNNIVWQSMQDKGSITETAKLPNFNGPTPPSFKAAGGLVVQIPVSEKDQNKVQLKNEILKLANQPGNQYLKNLIARNDVDWQKVILTEKDWDYKSQGLTAAGAAIIAIIVAVATAGAGAAALGTTTTVTSATTITVGGAQVAVAAGGSITTFGGTILGYTAASGAATVFTTSGLMINAAVTAIASQASVGLVNNQGDITKTLQQLGSKDSIKSLATSVITVGILDKIGGTEWMSQFNDTGITGRLITGTVNSAGSALVTTAINGGSLSENIENALLFNLANALQGSLAGEIKGLEDTNYILHKIAHAAAGCMAATVAKSDCEAGAIGAAIGEMAADLVPKSKSVEQMTPAEREEYNRKVLATTQLVAGGIAGLGGYDVNAAVQTANIAVTNNYLTSQQFKNLKGELDACSTNDCKTKIYLKYQTLSNSNDNNLRQACAGVNFNGAVCSTKINELLVGQDTAKGLRLYSEYISFNQFGKFDPQIQQKAQAVAGIHYLKNWENSNCKGLTDAACGQKYIALKDNEKENLRKALDQVESVPIYGTGILVGENIKVIATGLDFTDTEKSRLLALAETISLGVTKRLSHILNPVGSTIHIKNPTEKVIRNSDGINEVRPRPTSSDRNEFNRLNYDAAKNGEGEPSQVMAALYLQPYLGKMDPIRNVERDVNGKRLPNPDYRIISGPNTNKTVDFMFTNENLKMNPKSGEMVGLNTFFQKNLNESSIPNRLPPLQQQIQDHLAKADIVPMDLRTLSPSNQQALLNYIKTLPAQQQNKVLFIR
ncbi:DUF637 domain-containing protein [Acinetobacter proteolyticus]|uniref:Hemagglutinin n=1 Tax=Acinetobacter proteolyticus TaxID=1776741 RepID=A0A2N0WAZ6_9GAMM|nr:DUF637 domain-containing protein [Acinetobacter proteolyticus]PKF31651.1 hemagglutinin [Acinetobacter proteolyticus]